MKSRILAASAAVLIGLPGIAGAQDAAPVGDSRRPAIRMMEAVLTRAVLTGAEGLAQQIASGNPNMSFFTGAARSRGFVLDGYGVFFHVEIPEMQQSLVFSVTTLERDLALSRALEPLARVVASVPDGPMKLQAELAIKGLQRQVNQAPPLAGSANPAAPRGAIRSADATPVADTSPAALSPVPPLMLRDPNAAYREAVKTALIDAMLEHSRGLRIGPDEWLTVAAHRGDSPLAPNEIVTSSTLVLRVKGSDLAAYDADRTAKDMVRQRVEVREF